MSSPSLSADPEPSTNAAPVSAANDRYARQAQLPELGPEKQARLRRSRVAVFGCGALGGVLIDQLARAGVGHLTLIDRDTVELSNLHRQVLFEQSDADQGRPKAEAAADRVRAINPEVQVTAVPAHAGPSNVETLCGLAPTGAGPKVDLILDGLDNFETRLLLGDVADKHAVPMVYAGVVGTRGVCMPILPQTESADSPWEAEGGATPSMRELVPAPPAPGTMPTCDTAGVLGPAVAAIAAIQATEAIKILVADWSSVSRELVELDLWHGVFRRIRLEPQAPVPDPQDPLAYAYLRGAGSSQSTLLCGRDTVQILPAPGRPAVDLDRLAETLSPLGRVQRLGRAMLRFAPQGEAKTCTLSIFPDGRVLVQGTTEPTKAQAWVSRYLGN